MVSKDSYETEGVEALQGKGGPLALAGFHKDSGNFELQSSGWKATTAAAETTDSLLGP